MSDDPVASVDQLILEHLDAAELPKPVQELIFAALVGEEELRSVVGGGTATSRPQPPAAAADFADPAGAYLSRIEAQGFRGIGEAATLDLVPGPGLTIVTGRNGSGKSSFAEAAELALTGDNQRWADRTQVWKEGWRNLHTTGERYVRVVLGIEGHRGGATVECHWQADAGLDDRTSFLQLAGRPRQSVAELGWERPLELYRPFLSYSELGGLLSGSPSKMYDALHSVLGLGRLTQVEDLLKAARRDSDRARKAADEELPAVREAVAAHPDPRARQAEQLLAAPTVDLDRLDQLAVSDEAGDSGGGTFESLWRLAALGLPDPADVAAQVERIRAAQAQIADLAATPAAEARAVAGLLDAALRYHDRRPDQPCPVCRGRTLDARWAQEARTQLQRLTEQAGRLDQAHRSVRESCQQLRELVPATPAVLRADLDDPDVDPTDLLAAWLRWDELLRSEDLGQVAEAAVDRFDAVAAALAPVRTAAQAALDRRQQAWQPLAEQLRRWADTARTSRRAAQTYRYSQKAVTWLRGVGEAIRNQRLAPIASQATGLWTMLREDSNVDLGAVRLAGTGTSRKVALDVAVDGEPGAALGVMSQGELHALALSLFLPRATMAASPFRFLVIDDPVQSMDPGKVYGLAQVLDRVAADRQVVVFTHDDRLPTAVRHLGIKAHLRVVSRRERSQVSVQVDEKGDPALRYLDDARAVAKDAQVDPGLRTKVTCVLVRDAIEARCHDLVMVRDLRAGRAIADTEELLGQTTRLKQTVALALLGDPARAGEVHGELRKLHPRAPQVVDDANRGAHGGQVTGPLEALVADAQRLVGRLVAR